MDGPIRLYGTDEFVQPLIALPDRLDAGLAIPRPGEESAQRCEAPHHLAEGWWRRRRMAVVLQRLKRVPRSRFKDDLTGHGWIGTARHRDGVNTPGHDHINRQGVQEPLIRLHAQRLNLTSLLQRPDKACYVPPTAIPRPSQACPWQIRHRSSATTTSRIPRPQVG
jgi:hypothetical protein